MKGVQICSNKGLGPLQRGDNHKNAKMEWGHLRIFFSRTTRPSLTRLGTNHPWEEGLIFLLNKGDCSSPREGNSKSVKIFRTRKPKSIKLGTNYLWVKGIIKVCSIKGPSPLQRGDNH
jgi:hypothetical protein